MGCGSGSHSSHNSAGSSHDKVVKSQPSNQNPLNELERERDIPLESIDEYTELYSDEFITLERSKDKKYLRKTKYERLDDKGLEKVAEEKYEYFVPKNKDMDIWERFGDITEADKKIILYKYKNCHYSKTPYYLILTSCYEMKQKISMYYRRIDQ